MSLKGGAEEEPFSGFQESQKGAATLLDATTTPFCSLLFFFLSLQELNPKDCSSVIFLISRNAAVLPNEGNNRRDAVLDDDGDGIGSVGAIQLF